jgi:hypothetical protein
MGMKMAKADKKDMDAALQLSAILQDVGSGYYPSSLDEEESEADPTFFDEDNREHLRAFYDRVMACVKSAPGGIFRVIGGFHTVMHNDICDPDLDYLELHPRIRMALAAMPADAREHGDAKPTPDTIG